MGVQAGCIKVFVLITLFCLFLQDFHVECRGGRRGGGRAPGGSYSGGVSGGSGGGDVSLPWWMYMWISICVGTLALVFCCYHLTYYLKYRESPSES